MAQHVLSLEAPDTMNKCILRIVDTSIYNNLSPITCAALQITLPGFVRPTTLKSPIISPNFILNLTACDLEVQTSQCGTIYNDLPDGIYIIKYSVAPNDIVYVEYNHLRITKALYKIQGIYCDLDLGVCEPSATIKSKLSQIRLIQQQLNAAKAQVEFCHSPKKGMELYNYAVKQLDKITCHTCK